MNTDTLTKLRQIAQSKQHVLPGLAVAVAVGLGQAVILLCKDLITDMLFSSDILEIHAAKVGNYFESCNTGGSHKRTFLSRELIILEKFNGQTLIK